MIARFKMRRCACVTVALLVAASTCGCAGMKSSQSQLFGAGGSNFKSASVTYRIERQVASRSASTGWAKLLSPTEMDKPAERRVTMLAVRYPHPAGRAGYARLECVTATIPGTTTSQSSSWLKRVGKLADETMPGLTMAEGIHEAMGLDLPIGEVEGVLAQLQQSGGDQSAQSAATNSRQVVQVSYEIDGQTHPEHYQRVPQLERLIARVRNEGSVVSHSSSVVESLVSRPAANKAAAPATNVLPAQHVAPVTIPLTIGAIQPVSHEEALATNSPTMWRLPPVQPVR
jgi:hypothetical protein